MGRSKRVTHCEWEGGQRPPDHAQCAERRTSMKQISYEELHRRGYAKHEVSDMVDEGTIEWDEDLGAFIVWGELYK